ncbi:protein MIS12 homolog [Anopheles aquasalis]|uniref:protein MIS12 homolog n=1 Tax=Anopheles aquasalis TaxID=42839 RepID=UPI00215A8E5C|nr:protein MIS12 homolog [Anopheles aquasalis]
MEPNRAKEEYELQHFNFTAEEIVAQNAQLVQSILHKTLNAFTEQLIDKRQLSATQGNELRAQIGPTSRAMYDDCRPAIEELNSLFRKTFSIPDDLLLPTDLMHAQQHTDEFVKGLQQEVDEAKEAVSRGAIFLASLEAEAELHRALEPCYRAEGEIHEMLEEYQELEIVSNDLTEMIEQLESSGLLGESSESQGNHSLDNFLLQK